MDWGLTFLVGTLAAASGISLSLAVFAARRRAAPGARSYAVLMVAIAYWTAAVAGQLLSSDFAGRALWLKLQYPGVVLAAPAALVFILSFSGRANWITRRQLAFLAVEPLITLLLIATNDAHGLFWSFITPDDTTFPGLLPIPGAWGRLRLPYIFLMQLAGGMIILEMFSRSSPRYRRQAMVFGLGGVFPWISGVMTYGGINPFGTLNLAPFGFTLAGLFWGWGLFRWGLFDIVPVARYLVIEGMRDIVLVLDAKDRIVDLNPAAQRFLGVSAADAIGQAAATALPAWSGPLRGNDGAVSGALLHLGGGDAEERTLELLISPLDDGLGGQLGRLVVAYDVTQRVRAEAALERLALNDALTGLPNRTLLARRLSETLGKAGAAAAPCALLMMDLDGFKEVNDTFGHQVGDGLLRHVGQRLQAAALAGETPARLGGDEFAVLLPNVEGTEAATQAAQRMLAALEAPFLVEDMPLTVGASIGIALYPQHGDDANGLLRSADVAMYAAKRAGGGWAVYDPDADDHSPGKLALLSELRGAIAAGGLVLHYQPQIRLSDRAVVGAEALVRWEHPQLGLLPPDQFIALAERSGLIQALARWVLTAALRQSARWRSAGLDVPVSVNLSAANLRDTLLPGEIERLLTTYKTPPGGLTLELTENAVMTDPTEAAQALGRLRRLGVRIALDDFGIGQSSLTWLHRLPVDEIKIDRSFVLEMAGDEHGAAIARLTAETGHRFGLRVTAEGVDNADTLELLHGLGCDAAQGYVICPPLPAAELEDWLRRRR